MATNHIAQGLRLLANPNVSRMFIAYVVSYTGTAMAPIAMAFGVLELTGSAADAAFVIAAPTAASIVVLLLGGVIADRTSRNVFKKLHGAAHRETDMAKLLLPLKTVEVEKN